MGLNRKPYSAIWFTFSIMILSTGGAICSNWSTFSILILATVGLPLYSLNSVLMSVLNTFLVSLLFMDFHRFLTEFSFLPGKKSAILAHLFPNSICFSKSNESSYSDHFAFVKFGFRWFSQRARHYFDDRTTIPWCICLLIFFAHFAQFLIPCTFTTLSNRSSSWSSQFLADFGWGFSIYTNGSNSLVFSL